MKFAGPQPAIPYGYDLFITAFYQLCTERPVAEGAIVSLPFSKILLLSDYYSIDDTQQFIYCIQEMDAEFIKEMTRVSKSQQKKAKAK